MSDEKTNDSIRYPWREWSVAVVQNMERFDIVCTSHNERLDEVDKAIAEIKTERLTKARITAILTGVISSIVSIGLTALGLWLAYG